MSTSQKDENLAKEIRLFQEDQGLHECEVTFDGETGLLDQQKKCKKNPNHESFIPITKFKKYHLSKYCNGDDIYNIIQTEAALTVRILVSYTSEARPVGYPFSKYRGSHATRTGTGWVRWARDKFTEKDNKLCPCYDCSVSLSPKKEWGRVYVRTAQHVVFDTPEALCAKFTLFYDRPGDSVKCPILHGVAVTLNILSDDWSELSCVTHDLSLWDKLDELDRHRDVLFEKVKQEYIKHKHNNTTEMAIIISHPHGCSKQVSIGEWTQQMKVGQYDYTQYIYTTCTCRGSSGAPVYILGRDRLFMMPSHPHSKRCINRGFNQSATGWD